MFFLKILWILLQSKSKAKHSLFAFHQYSKNSIIFDKRISGSYKYYIKAMISASKVNDENSNLTIVNSSFNNNFARSNGAAIYNKHNLISKNNKYTNNFVDVNGGGAIYNIGSANLTSLNDVFENNSANFTGGAIHSEFSCISYIENATFKSNNARYNKGGAIYNFEYSIMTVKNSKFIENFAFLSTFFLTLILLISSSRSLSL